ncbi:hypothetical protein CR513_43897, partial [Mucuna pruriens]
MGIDCKVERVLVDQGSLVNTTFQKLGKTKEELEACPRTLIGAIDIQTTFGAGPDVKIVPLKFTIVNAQASYNIILEWPTLNQLRVIVSTPHLCTKYLVVDRVGTIRANQQMTYRCYKASLKIKGWRWTLRGWG